MTDSSKTAIPVAEAASRIQTHLPLLPDERVTVPEAGGRVLRETVRAERDQPPFHRVTMDGIALASAAWASGRREFRLAGTQAAGAAPTALSDSGDCIEVMTGAVLPAGCDCVVPVEDIETQGGRVRLLESAQVEPMRFVHAQGTDHAAGTVLLEPGYRLRAPEMALVAASGLAAVRVAARPDVVLVSTGDELVGPGRPIAAHQIRRSNDLAMAAALRLAGYGDPLCVHLPDQQQRIHATLEQLLSRHQVLVLSGGVSRGRFDFVPDVLSALGVRKVFHRVAQRPGKPMWFGNSPGGCTVFALPGNPVSTLVCFYRYVLPALRAAQGDRSPGTETVRLGSEFEFAPALTCFLAVEMQNDEQGEVMAMPRPTNTSGDFTSLASTHGFVELAAGTARFPRGHSCTMYRW